MTNGKNTMKKAKNHAFGKNIYLLGKDIDGQNCWLESPSFDCGWYWGFGYVETYTNNRHPHLSRDISSHRHIDSSFLGNHNGEYIHNLYDFPELVATTFTEKEGWELSELFEQFYLLRKMADFTYKDRPGCHITTSPVDHGDMKDWNKHINTVMIPRVTASILAILSPDE